MRSQELLGMLMRAPLDYRVVRQRGSHRRLESRRGYPPLGFAWHDGVTLAPGLVRKVLTKDVCLSVDDALRLL